jgi:outer membrane receptor protein involved in Fe transport
MSRSFRAFFAAACLVTALFAQSGNQGSIAGTVTDASGAVVPKASVTATNKQTSNQFTSSTSDQGTYNFPVLPVGDYTLSVSGSGFAENKRDVRLSVGSKLTIDVRLATSGQTENIVVTDESPVIETGRTQVSNNVNEQQIRELPVNGRNFIDFALLTPGVGRDVRTGDLSFAGQRGTLNSLTVDGADNNNTFFGQTIGRTGSGRAPYQFSQDAVQEFQVISNSYTAEQGRAGGAVINVITKSGTNKYHGSIFEYYRDRGLAANDPVLKQNTQIQTPGAPQPRKPGYHFNQFGGTLGGPIVKDKLFFFFNYDGQRNTQLQTTSLQLPVLAAPTAQETAAINYLSARSAPYTRGLNQDAYLFKGDWNVSQKHQLSLRYNRQNFTGKNFENGGTNQAIEHTGNSLVKTDSGTAQLTSAFTARFVNVARFQYQIDSEPGQANSDNPEATVNFNGTSFIVGRNSFSPRETTIKRQQYADTATMAYSKHTLKFGADILHDNILNFFPGNFSGLYSFANLKSFGCSLQGIPLDGSNPACPLNSGNQLREAFAGTGTTGPQTHPDITQTGFFAQDDWKVLSNLTVNVGLRYDVQNSAKPPVENPVATAAGILTNRLNTDKNNFAPRLGFAWDPFKTGKVVVRGGYGLFYGVTPSIMVGTAHSNNGVNVQTITFRDDTPAGRQMPFYPDNICGAPSAQPNCAAPAGGTVGKPTIYVFQPDYQQPRVQQASFGVDYQVAPQTVVSFGYLFAKGDDLQRTRDINLGTPTPVTATANGSPVTFLQYPATRPNAAFNQIFQFESSAHSNYNGLTFQVNRRFAQHFSAQAAYTWSHAIDDAPDATAAVPGADDAKLLYSPLFPQLDRASSVNDIRHRFVGNWVWDLNYRHFDRAMLEQVLGGWELSGILTAQSGTPYTGLITGGNPDLNQDGNRATERAANEGRNAFNTPVFVSLDPRLTKRFKVTEGSNLQLFAEAFNILNRYNKVSINSNEYIASGTLAAPVLTLNNSATSITRFGLPRSSFLPMNGARIVQLGAKFNF